MKNASVCTVWASPRQPKRPPRASRAGPPRRTAPLAPRRLTRRRIGLQLQLLLPPTRPGLPPPAPPRAPRGSAGPGQRCRPGSPGQPRSPVPVAHEPESGPGPSRCPAIRKRGVRSTWARCKRHTRPCDPPCLGVLDTDAHRRGWVVLNIGYTQLEAIGMWGGLFCQVWDDAQRATLERREASPRIKDLILSKKSECNR